MGQIRLEKHPRTIKRHERRQAGVGRFTLTSKENGPNKKRLKFYHSQSKKTLLKGKGTSLPKVT